MNMMDADELIEHILDQRKMIIGHLAEYQQIQKKPHNKEQYIDSLQEEAKRLYYILALDWVIQQLGEVTSAKFEAPKA